MKHQSMSSKVAQLRIDVETLKYAELLRDEIWSLETAHSKLTDDSLDLFEISGLAKAIACYQCSN